MSEQRVTSALPTGGGPPAARGHARIPSELATALILGLVCAVVGGILLLETNNRPVFEPREHRIFMVVDGMIASGDYLLPRIGTAPHINKPPLYYWLAAAVARTTDLPPRVAYRLPSVVAAVAMIPCVFWMARAVGGRSVALSAALAVPALGLLYPNGRVANYDMLLATLACASVAAFGVYVRNGAAGWLVAAGAAFVLAFLVKATPALVAVLVPIILILAERRRLPWLWSPRGLTFVLVPILVSAAWLALMVWHTPEAWAHFVDELLLPFGREISTMSARHYEGPFYYALRLISIALPASLLVPVIAMRLVSTRAYEDEPPLRWALLAIVLLVVVFSLVPQKQRNYMTIILPYYALLIGDAVMFLVGSGRRWPGLLLFRLSAAILGLLLLVAAAVVFLYLHVVVARPLPLALLGAAVLFGAAIGVLAAMARERRPAALALALSAWLYLQAIHYGSLDVWEAQFRVGEVYEQPYYHADHWEPLFQRYPSLRRLFPRIPAHRAPASPSPAG